jgi:hypothetical protein
MHRLLLGIFCALGILPVFAQEPNREEKPESIQMRVLCHQPVEGATDLVLMRGEEIVHRLTMMPAMVSDPLAVGRGDWVLAKITPGAEKPTPLITIRIPDVGKRFALALFPAAADKASDVYQHLLIRTDGLKFGASDLYLFNFTRVPVAGLLGSQRFTLQPGKSEVVRPVPPANERMYQARFFHENEGEARIFSDTRWPLAATARVFVFFLPDAQLQTISYVSFREYGPFE